MRKLKRLALFLALLFLAGFVYPAKARAAARLFFDPEAGNYEVGDQFPVKLEIDPSSEDIIAIDAIINYDSEKLSVKSIEMESYFVDGSMERQGSNISIEEDTASLIIYSFSDVETFSMNTEGTIATINFEALAEGVASVTFACESGVDGDTTIWPPEGLEEVTDCASIGSGSYTIGAGTNPTAVPTSVEAEPTSSSLPESGIIEPLVLTIVLGTLFVGLGFLGLIW